MGLAPGLSPLLGCDTQIRSVQVLLFNRPYVCLSVSSGETHLLFSARSSLTGLLRVPQRGRERRDRLAERDYRSAGAAHAQARQGGGRGQLPRGSQEGRGELPHPLPCLSTSSLSLDTAAGSLFCPCCRSSLLAATHRTTLRESVGSMRRNLPRGGSAAQQTAPRNFNLPIAQTAQQPAQTRLITGARSHRPSSVSSMFLVFHCIFQFHLFQFLFRQKATKLFRHKVTILFCQMVTMLKRRMKILLLRCFPFYFSILLFALFSILLFILLFTLLLVELSFLLFYF